MIRFGPAVSPHLAAELAGREIDVPALVGELRAAGEPLVVEGIGGLLVPIAPGWDVRALARALGLGVVIAARPGLGTINHTLLTLEAGSQCGPRSARRRADAVAGEPSDIERSNRDTIERLGEIEVATLPALAELTPAALAARAPRSPTSAG